ncbi:MAG: hypothetical protein NVSMB52_00330 [Chloroflexota bacterium]
MLDGDDISQAPGLHDLVHCSKEGGVSKHMRDAEQPSAPFARSYDSKTLPWCNCHRFFQEYMVPSFEGHDSRLGVKPVRQRADHALGLSGVR